IVAPARIAWRFASVTDVLVETRRAKTLVLDVPGWPGHVADQHVDVRLTAEDGYRAQRSYSIASAAEDAALAITVELGAGGDPQLAEDLRQVVLAHPETDEQSRADLRVGEAFAGQPGDRGILGGEVLARLDGPLA